MHFREIQEKLHKFDEDRGWNKFPASLVFAHLIEELGEISRHITVKEGYKVIGLGHKAPEKEELGREFAQAFNLFVQIANTFNIDLESVVLTELDIMEKRFSAEEWSHHMNKRDSQ
jgi:NTP pyrophosphatase (non-canonical NTP hydrolase)